MVKTAALILLCSSFSIASQINCTTMDPAVVVVNTSAGRVLRPASGAQLTVCAAGSALNPTTGICSPLTSLVTPSGAAGPNPMTADSNGNFAPVCVNYTTNSNSSFMMQVGGTGLTTITYDRITISNDPVQPTFTGGATLLGSLTLCPGCSINFLNGSSSVDTVIWKDFTTPGLLHLGIGFADDSGLLQTSFFRGGNGAVGTPTFTFLNDLTTGVYRIGASRVGIALGGVNALDLQGTLADFKESVNIPSGQVYKINSDTGVSRDSAGVIDLGNGSAADKTATVQARRYKAAGGTALATTDFAFTGAGNQWGVGEAFTSVTGIDQGFSLVITTGTAPAASPGFNLTYKDGTWTNSPIPLCANTNTTGGGAFGSSFPVTSTATVLSYVFNGTPTASVTYTITCTLMGR